MSAKQTSERELFNEQTAPDLARSLHATVRWGGKGASRFAYFTSKSRFVVVASEKRAETSTSHLPMRFRIEAIVA